jgi:hypothetical protein
MNPIRRARRRFALRLEPLESKQLLSLSIVGTALGVAGHPTPAHEMAGLHTTASNRTAAKKAAPKTIFAVGEPITFTVPAGVNTGMIQIGQFADKNDLANLKDTTYNVRVNWGDSNNPKDATTFSNNSFPNAGKIKGFADLWVIESQHVYATPNPYPVTITVQKGGGNTITLHATAIVTAAELQMGSPDFVGQGKPTPWAPGDELATVAIFTPPQGHTYKQYTFTVKWGDPSPLDTKPTFYQPPHSLPGDPVAIVMDHIYASGGPYGAPKHYTITVTVTGPGLKKPDTGSTDIAVFQYAP